MKDNSPIDNSRSNITKEYLEKNTITLVNALPTANLVNLGYRVIYQGEEYICITDGSTYSWKKTSRSIVDIEDISTYSNPDKNAIYRTRVGEYKYTDNNGYPHVIDKDNIWFYVITNPDRMKIEYDSEYGKYKLYYYNGESWTLVTDTSYSSQYSMKSTLDSYANDGYFSIVPELPQTGDCWIYIHVDDDINKYYSSVPALNNVTGTYTYKLYHNPTAQIGANNYKQIGGGGSVSVDNITIEKNNQDQLQLKDDGITFEKVNSFMVANSINTGYTLYAYYNSSYTRTYYIKNPDGATIQDYYLSTGSKVGTIDNWNNNRIVINSNFYTRKPESDIDIGSVPSEEKLTTEKAVKDYTDSKQVSDTYSYLDTSFSSNIFQVWMTLKDDEDNLITSKAIPLAEKVSDYSTLSDTDKLSFLDLSTKELKDVALSAVNTYIQSKLNGAISTVLTSNLTNGKLVGVDSNGKLADNPNAITADATGAIKLITNDANGLITSYTNKSLGRGLDDQSNVIGHSNSITAQTTSKFGSITFDAQGHITGFTEKHLYEHIFVTKYSDGVSYKNICTIFKIIKDNNTPFTLQELKDFFINNGFTSLNNIYPTSGIHSTYTRYVATTSGGSNTSATNLPNVAVGIYFDSSANSFYNQNGYGGYNQLGNWENILTTSYNLFKAQIVQIL